MEACTLQLQPGLRRLTAPNPSPMTFRGTNTYLVGEGALAVIDPGPADHGHLQALLGALDPGERISHIFVTHSHLDHSPLARPLSEVTGAPVFAFGTHLDGRSPVMERLAQDGKVGGGEGVDRTFSPDECLEDGTTISGPSWTMEALHTPGHMSNHMCFAWQDSLFSGDHVMGWASTIVSPPDGDLAAFLDSCNRLAARSDRVLYPGHGDPVPNPKERIAWLLAHRHERERQILAALQDGAPDISALTRQVYVDTPESLLPAAQRNVLAHLIRLSARDDIALPEASDIIRKFLA